MEIHIYIYIKDVESFVTKSGNPEQISHDNSHLLSSISSAVL